MHEFIGMLGVSIGLAAGIFGHVNLAVVSLALGVIFLDIDRS